MAKKTRKPTRRPARARKTLASKKKVQPVPAAYGSVTAGLAIRNCAAAIDYYKRAFGAKEIMRMEGPGGKIMHAEIRIGDRIVMLGEEMPEMGAPSPQALGGTTASLMLYVKDCDAVFARAVAEGGKATMPPADMFWGDRYGMVVDPFGHRWGIATHKADLTPKQVAKGQAAFMAQMAAGQPPAA
jgi:PhnB protein